MRQPICFLLPKWTQPVGIDNASKVPRDEHCVIHFMSAEFRAYTTRVAAGLPYVLSGERPFPLLAPEYGVIVKTSVPLAWEDCLIRARAKHPLAKICLVTNVEAMRAVEWSTFQQLAFTLTFSAVADSIASEQHLCVHVGEILSYATMQNQQFVVREPQRVFSMDVAAVRLPVGRDLLDEEEADFLTASQLSTHMPEILQIVAHGGGDVVVFDFLFSFRITAVQTASMHDIAQFFNQLEHLLSEATFSMSTQNMTITRDLTNDLATYVRRHRGAQPNGLQTKLLPIKCTRKWARYTEPHGACTVAVWLTFPPTLASMASFIPDILLNNRMRFSCYILTDSIPSGIYSGRWPHYSRRMSWPGTDAEEEKNGSNKNGGPWATTQQRPNGRME